MSVFVNEEDVNVIFLIDNQEIDKYNAKIIKVNENKTYNVLINNFENENSIYNDVIANTTINDKYPNNFYKNQFKTLEIHNIQPFIQSTTGGAIITKKLLINITKLQETSSQPSTQSNNQPLTSIPTTQAYTIIKDKMKEIINELKSNNNDINLEELLEMAQKKLQKNLDFASMSNSKLVLFRDTDDKYGFFSNIQSGSTSTMNNNLKDIDFTSALYNAGKSKDERLKKYYYLLHSINSYGLTTLQWACFYNRVDIVMLILSYLVGGEKEYVRKYINYFNNNVDNDELYTGRAYDMIGRSTNISLYKSMVQSLKSNSTQAVKSIGSLVGNLLSFNLKTGLVDIFRKTKNVITAPGQVPLDAILIAFGSIQDGNNTETNNGLDIKDKYDDELMLSDTDQNLSMGVSNVPKNAMSRLKRGYNSLFGSKKGGKYKSRRYHKQNNRFTRRNYINKSSKTRR
jgi:hypothetical protein